MSVTAAAVISLRAVELVRGSRRILAGVDLDIPAGVYGAVTGPSGSGKTSLFNLIAGLLRPTAGSVTVLDQDLARLDDAELARLRRQSLATIFQAYNLVPDYTLLENVTLPDLIEGRAPDARKALDCLGAVGLANREADRASSLSGGERQRLAIARSLHLRPKLLLADEPTGNLDEQATEAVLSALAALHDRGTTVVVATHDPHVINELPALFSLGTREAA